MKSDEIWEKRAFLSFTCFTGMSFCIAKSGKLKRLSTFSDKIAKKGQKNLHTLVQFGENEKQGCS
jgi:hypothetical protein